MFAVSDLLCPLCYNSLHFYSSMLICDECGEKYRIIDNIIDMLRDINSDDSLTLSLYKSINQKFNQSIYGRFITSINQGYYNEDPLKQSSNKVNPYSQALYDFVTANSNLQNKSILDIGCGRGGFLLYLNKKCNASTCVGLDFCLEGLQVASNKKTSNPIIWVCGNSKNMPFKKLTFDIAFSIESGVSTQLIENASRVLKRKGELVIADYLYKVNYDEIIDVIKRYFEIKKMENISKEIMGSINRVSNGWSEMSKNKIYTVENAGGIGSKRYNELLKGDVQYYALWLEKKVQW